MLDNTTSLPLDELLGLCPFVCNICIFLIYELLYESLCRRVCDVPVVLVGCSTVGLAGRAPAIAAMGGGPGAMG